MEDKQQTSAVVNLAKLVKTISSLKGKFQLARYLYVLITDWQDQKLGPVRLCMLTYRGQTGDSGPQQCVPLVAGHAGLLCIL